MIHILKCDYLSWGLVTVVLIITIQVKKVGGCMKEMMAYDDVMWGSEDCTHYQCLLVCLSWPKYMFAAVVLWEYCMYLWLFCFQFQKSLFYNRWTNDCGNCSCDIKTTALTYFKHISLTSCWLLAVWWVVCNSSTEGLCHTPHPDLSHLAKNPKP